MIDYQSVQVVEIRMVCGSRQPPRLVTLHSVGLVASLVNTPPKWPPYATGSQSINLAKTKKSDAYAAKRVASLCHAAPYKRVE